MRTIFLVAVSCMILWSAAPAQDTLRVMTYNIYHAEQPYNKGESSLRDIASLINRERPDFVALQEIDEMTDRLAALNDSRPYSLTDSLAGLTGMTGYFGKAIDYGGGGYGGGLLSVHPLEFQKVMLANPEEGEDRVLLFVEAKTASGKPFIFGGTHLDHQSAANKIAQVGDINEYFAGEESPVLLGGDFNFTPGSEPYLQMQQQWVDAALLFNDEPEPTIPSKNPDRRIDYFFLSKHHEWEVIDFRTIKVDYSDHLPVMATIVIR